MRMRMVVVVVVVVMVMVCCTVAFVWIEPWGGKRDKSVAHRLAPVTVVAGCTLFTSWHCGASHTNTQRDTCLHVGVQEMIISVSATMLLPLQLLNQVNPAKRAATAATALAGRCCCYSLVLFLSLIFKHFGLRVDAADDLPAWCTTMLASGDANWYYFPWQCISALMLIHCCKRWNAVFLRMTMT